MEHDEVIEVLQEEIESGEITLTGEFGEALTQAISIIKELDIERSARHKKDVAYTLLQGKYDAVLKKCKEHKAENGELRKENEELKTQVKHEKAINQITDILTYKERIAQLQQELTELKELEDLKKAVASEGLGVEEIRKVSARGYCTKRNENKELDSELLEDICNCIHEAQTKYKKEELNK